MNLLGLGHVWENWREHAVTESFFQNSIRVRKLIWTCGSDKFRNNLTYFGSN